MKTRRVKKLHHSDGIGQSDYYSRVRSWPSKFDIAVGAQVLDIGCGDGALGASLKANFQCAVTGVEVLPEHASKAELVLDGVHCCDALDFLVQSESGKFDVVIMSDSLEHFIDPDAVLTACHRVLKGPNSKLLIALPNVRNFRVTLPLLLFDKWSYADEGLLDRTHLKFFTENSIRHTLSVNGFKVTKIFLELPMSSKVGFLNFLTGGIFKRHLTSHYYIEACSTKS